MATHSSILAWKITWMEEFGRLNGVAESQTRLSDFTLPGDSDSKESIYNSGDPGSIPRWEKIPWRRAWQPTPVVLPGEFHGQRSLVGYSPWGRKEFVHIPG